MSEVIPTLKDSHKVRTYDTNYAGSDIESVVEEEFVPVEEANEEVYSVAERLEQNQEYMEEVLRQQQDPPWILETQMWRTERNQNVVLIKKPTASKLSHRLLNPYIYRNIENLGSLNELAELLHTPQDWEERYTQMIQDGYILQKYTGFKDLPENTHEKRIHCDFIGLVGAIATRLNVHCFFNAETPIIVGGILAKHEYDLRSNCDPYCLSSSNGSHFLATEVKTARTFKEGNLWYNLSRGIQTISALYAYNCPTFLFTQNMWKLFVENDERNTILTYPYGDIPDHTPHQNSTVLEEIGRPFLKAIVICLLSERGSLVPKEKGISITMPSLTNETPVRKRHAKAKELNQSAKRRKSARLMRSDSDHRPPQPKFFCGYDTDGKPLYQLVRVLPEEDVMKIEAGIIAETKSELKHESSELTLIE